MEPYAAPQNIDRDMGGTAVMQAGKVIVVAATLSVLAGAAWAADTAPNDVKFVDNAVSQSLTGKPGDAAEGAKVLVSRKLGNCLACHQVSALNKELFHGDVGPSLDGAGSRWKPEELRAIVTDSKHVFGPDTVMPGFYSLNVGMNVTKDLVGKTILTAEQVEDVVAYVATLKE
jgi:sulfur-oxidizing protein SoxX